MFEMIPLFAKPTYVGKTDIDNDIKDYIQSLDYYNIENTTGQLSNDTYVLENSLLQQLKSNLEDNIRIYAHEMLQVDDSVEFYITNSWVTLHEQGDFAPSHIHTNSLISGTVYINIPDDDDSLFQFHAPDTYKVFGLFKPKVKSLNAWNSSTWAIKPETGTILLFPSDLSHSTTAMTSALDNRYCLAFNVFVKGELSDIPGHDKGSINRLVL